MNEQEKSEVQIRFDAILTPTNGSSWWQYECHHKNTPDVQRNGIYLTTEDMHQLCRPLMGSNTYLMTYAQQYCYLMLAELSTWFAVRYFIALQRSLIPDGCEQMSVKVDTSWVYAWLKNEVYPRSVEDDVAAFGPDGTLIF
jgi:hypothetical protein